MNRQSPHRNRNHEDLMVRMEGEPEQMEMGMSQEDMAKGISEVRIALVGNAADVLYDISRNVEKDAINFAFKEYLDYFKLSLTSSPGVFSREIDSNNFRTDSDEMYSENQLKVFSKRMYPVCGVFLLCPILSSFHAVLLDLMAHVFLTMKHNHSPILAESIGVLIRMMSKLCKLINVPGASFKTLFKYDQPRRVVQFRTPASSISVNSIIHILKLILPHLDVIKKNSLLIVPLLQTVQFVVQLGTVSTQDKVDTLLAFGPHITFPQGQMLWCSTILHVIKLAFKSDSPIHDKSLHVFLNRIAEYQFPVADTGTMKFLVEFESQLITFILGTTFKESQNGKLQSEIMDLYKGMRKVMSKNGWDSQNMLRKETSVDFASNIYENLPMALPILADVVHKEMFRVLNSNIFVVPINYSEVKSRAPIWYTINGKWVAEVHEAERVSENQNISRDVKRLTIKKLLERTTGFIRLIRAVLSNGDALVTLRRAPRYGTLQELIFSDEFVTILRALLKLQSQVSSLIEGDASSFLEWLLVLAAELDDLGVDDGARLDLQFLQTQLVYHITYPFFPSVHNTAMDFSDLQQHRRIYGLEFMERSLRVLGSDFFHHCRDKTVILHVIHTAMESDLPSCNKGILSLIIDVKHICRALNKDKTMEYLTKLIMSKVWTDDEELGVLVPKAICRLGCLLTKANAPIRNGICEVCDRGIHFYEPSNCKMQQIREFIRILIQRGSIAGRIEILDSMIYLNRHGLVPRPDLIGNFLFVIQHPIQFKLLVKLLQNSVPFLRVNFPKQESMANAAEMFHLIFIHLRNFLKSFGLDIFDGLVDLLDALAAVSKSNNEFLAIEISKIVLLILTLSWSPCIVNKCRLLLRSLAETRHVKTSEYMGQVREHVVEDFVEMCLLQVFGSRDVRTTREEDQSQCDKCEVLLRALESAMEFNREDFVRVYFPVILAHTIPLSITDRRARLMTSSLAQFGLVNLKELFETHFPYYFPAIGMSRGITELNKIIRILETSGMSVTSLMSLNCQPFMNELLSYLSVDKQRVKCLFTSMLLRQQSKHLAIGDSPPTADVEIRNYIAESERLMAHCVYLDCKIESPFDSDMVKRRLFNSFIELISFLQNLISGTKMRVAKLLNSCSKKSYLQELVLHGWKAYTLSLDDAVLPSMMSEILASVLYLQSLPNVGKTGVFEEIAYHIISEKHRITRDYRPHVFYLEQHVQNRQTVSLLRNSKHTGSKLFEFLIESLRSGNTHIRFQALLAVQRVVNYEDTSVDLKESLEDTQFVHPNVCRLILALLDCVQSQDQAVSKLTMSVIGELGAVDYYRMKVKNMDRQSRRDGATIFPTGVPFAHAYIDMLRKQYQGTELSLQADIDMCTFAVQEVLKIYNIGEHNAEHPIWKALSPESKSLFSTLIRSKFKVADVILEHYPSPIYGTKFGKTFQDWCKNFVLQTYKSVTSHPAKEIFRVTLPILVRSLPVAVYLLPYVALFAALDGKPSEKLIIYNELKKICRIWYVREEQAQYTDAVRTRTPFGDDSHFEEPAPVDANLADRLAVTNAVFSIVDLVSFVSRYGTSHFTILNNIAMTGRSGIANSPSPISSVKGTPLTLQQVKDCRSIIPDPICMARAAFQTQSYQRALVNLEEFLFAFPELTQRYLSFLQRIFIALEDTDSVVGVSAVRRGKPNIREETLELLATAKKEDAASKFQVMMQKGFADFDSENVLMQGYLSIEKPEMALTIMNGLAARRLDVRSSPLDDCRIEACWKLQRWGELTTNLKSVRADLSSRGSLMHAAILSHFQRKRYSTVIDIIGQAREKCLQSLSTADLNIDSYHRRYAEITRLHILSEIEQAVDVMKRGEKPMNVRTVQGYRLKVSNLLKNWKERLKLVQNSLSIIEPIVNTRKALLHIMKDNTRRLSIAKLYASALRDCWLTFAKLEIRAKNYGRANTCIQEARQFRSAEVFIQDAKFLALRGDMDRGIRTMRECMKHYFPSSKIKAWEAAPLDDPNNPIPEEQELCAKSLLLLAKFNDEKCNVDMDVNIKNYLQVTLVNKKSEKNFFQLAGYFDSIWTNQTPRKQYEMQESVVRFYCKSLEYGSKHVYQSLPRLLFVWFNFASNVPSPPTEKQRQQERDAMAEYRAMLELHHKTVKIMSTHIAKLYNTVPAYIFLTVYSQLISRICHPNAQVWNQLKGMIAGIVGRHPHQAIWMMMAVSKSTYRMRKTRCAEILRTVEEKNPTLKTLINDYNILADQLIDLANSEYNGGKMTTIDVIAPALVRLLKKPSFSSILMPFQQFLNVTISRVGSFPHNINHKPFQHQPVYIHGIEKNVEVMPSLQRPKKITLRGNDGRMYGILCKPEDDLRKDSKVMEMNNIVNWYLGKNPEARERDLHIRTYAVVALNEDTGLLEWVANLQGLRPLLLRMYRERGLQVTHQEVKELYASGTDMTAAEKLEGFQTLVNRHPPVLREWFRTFFSDPQEWYTARSTFTRTCAVMSMVGYLIGLGDRHGENILLDSISGDVVHVDFNCLFNKGETFEVPEVVPFRLTHNMENAMGALGTEGPFRRSCEITVDILRQNSAVFMSVLRPFVFDPLVEWSRNRRGREPAAASTSTTGEVSNSMAMENIRAIQLRLQGVARNLTKELNVPLSVEAQVSYLIKEATDPSNLSVMYVGWGSFY